MQIFSPLHFDVFNMNELEKAATAKKVEEAMEYMRHKNVSIRRAAEKFAISKSTLHRALLKQRKEEKCDSPPCESADEIALDFN